MGQRRHTHRARRYDFRDVLSALGQAEGAEQALWWFDICTVNQQPEAQRQFPPDYFYTAFKDGIASIGRTVLVLLPFDDPIPLTRSWCLWEILCTAEAPGAALEVRLGAAAEAALEAALATDLDRVLTIMTRVDIARAEASSQQDQDRIASAVDASASAGGVAGINTTIKAELRAWLAATAAAAVARRDELEAGGCDPRLLGNVG